MKSTRRKRPNTILKGQVIGRQIIFINRSKDKKISNPMSFLYNSEEKNKNSNGPGPGTYNVPSGFSSSLKQKIIQSNIRMGNFRFLLFS